ncbi:hypothetical protein R6Q57_023013, partial [Mikania cordata]
VESIRSKKKYLNINIIDLINVIPNPINRITFSRNTRHLGHTCKEIYSLIREMKPESLVIAGMKLTYEHTQLMCSMPKHNIGTLRAFNIIPTKYESFEHVGVTSVDCKNKKNN